MPRAIRWRRVPWTTVIALGVAWWALPRLLPHIGAVADVRARETRPLKFSAVTLTGETLSSESLSGSVVLINVWATWCLPCRAEMPLLESTWQRHRQAGLRVIGASIDRGDPNVVRAFAVQRGVSYPVAIIDRRTLEAIGGVQGVPTSILVGRDGRVRHRVIGPIGPISLEPAIRRALAERGDAAP
jgi:cytochrome c biogenesis protein CcmG, thiol:disulfide interchange protein DsbE